MRTTGLRRGRRVAGAAVVTAAIALAGMGTAGALAGNHRPIEARTTSTTTGAQAASNGDANGSLTAVSCAAANACLATGYYTSAGQGSTALAEVWNGRNWSLTPPLPDADIASVNDVACSTPSSCMAVGTLSNATRSSSTYTAAWNGSGWTVIPSPNPSPMSSSLYWVSCVSPTDCMAMGYQTSGASNTEFGMTWDGHHWTPRSMPSPAGSSLTWFDLACPAAGTCIAVGTNFGQTTGGSSASSEVWNGKAWTLRPVPAPAGATSAELQSVDCLTSSDCLAVGTYSTPANQNGFNLAETWNGQHWAVVASLPNPKGTTFPFFSSVACASAADCLAVGSAEAANRTDALAESWNGHSWTALPLVRPQGMNAANFGDDACVAGGRCVIVGGQSVGPPTYLSHTLAVTWDGSHLAVVPSVDGSSPVTQISPGVQWLSQSCTYSSAEVEQARDPKLDYLYEDWIGCGIATIAFDRSTDGGRTFERPVLMHGPKGSDNVWDPAVSVAPDGTVYASFMASDNSQSFPVVEVSFDHGATFRYASDLLPPPGQNFGDRDFIAAGSGGTVYLTWDYGPSYSEVKIVCFPGGSCGFSAGDLNIVLQKSTDHGKTWGPMVHVSSGYPDGGADIGPLVVEPDGRVDVLYQALTVTNLHTLAFAPGYLWFSSSTDGGANFSKPIEIDPSVGSVSLESWWIDGDIGIDAAGNLYASWDTQGAADIGWLSWSSNHGRTWSPPLRVTPDTDHAAHIVQVVGSSAGQAVLGWLTDSSPAGYALWLQPFSISHGLLGNPIRASLGTYGTGAWPGDTFGMSLLDDAGGAAGQECVAATWGGGVLRPIDASQGDMFAVNTGLGSLVSRDCPTLPGYRLIGAGGGVLAYHDTSDGAATTNDAVGEARAPGGGYWIAGADGGVFSIGAHFHGSLPAEGVRVHDIVGIAPTADGGGYWLAGSDGAVYAFGDARVLGGVAGEHLVAPVVGISAMPFGQGYRLVAADGGVFDFGNARFRGSAGGEHLVAPIVGIATMPSGNGYWLAAKEGGVFTFGDATFHGSCPSRGSGCAGVDDVVGIAGTPAGGYWLAGADGAVLTFGNAQYFGSGVGSTLAPHVVGIAS